MLYVSIISDSVSNKPVTDEQVFYDYDYMLWQVFMWQVLFAKPKCTCVYATNFIWQVS